MAVRKFAGVAVKIDTVTVAKVTDFSDDENIGEVDVTGSEDVSGASDILESKFEAARKDETLALGGIMVIGDSGQSDVFDAIAGGLIVVLRQTYNDGTGTDFTGFFQNMKKAGSVSDAIVKWSGNFRVNSKVAVTP